MTPTNPALVAREGAIPDWLKSGFLALFVFVLCWGGAIAYWRTTRSNPAMGELLSYLLGLPATLLLMFFTGRKLLARPAISAPSPTASTTPATSTLTSAQTSPLAILVASLRLPHGASLEELASAIAENKARADLDKDLVGADGFPVMAARSSEAVDKELQEEIREWQTLHGVAELHFSDEQWRAVTLASAVVADLAAETEGLMDQVTAQTRLQLILALPKEWDAVHRRAIGMWLKHEVTRHGWAADRVVVTADEVMTPSAIFKRLTQDSAATRAPLIAIVVASASHIGEETIAQWVADDSLFTTSQPQGKVPGEGAAGLLITNQANVAGDVSVALLEGIEEGRRALSADESKRSDSTLLGELSARVLDHSETNASDVAVLIADTGNRSSRTLELMAHVSASLPQLEETGDVVRVGVASGTCDAVQFMTALALGTHYVTERGAPVLCISNEDPYCRAVALMRPSNLLSKAE